MILAVPQTSLTPSGPQHLDLVSPLQLSPRLLFFFFRYLMFKSQESNPKIAQETFQFD